MYETKADMDTKRQSLSATFTVDSIARSEQINPEAVGYRRLCWEIAQRAAVWHQLAERVPYPQTKEEKELETKAFNALWRLVEAHGKRFFKNWKTRA